jgi:hypothetical protein
MGDLSDDFRAFREHKKASHENWAIHNLTRIQESGIPFEKNKESCL